MIHWWWILVILGIVVTLAIACFIAFVRAFSHWN